MANVPLSKDVPRIYVPSLSVPKIYAPRITVPKLNVPKVRVVDPMPKNKHVVGIGDILLGDLQDGTRQLQNTLKDNGYEDLMYVPIINRIVGTGLAIDERFITPLFREGDVIKTGINAIESLGESMDLLANPIKSLMPWAGGGTAKDFLRSLGLSDGEDRMNYQWDTGNWALDVVGEMLSDPTTIMTLGGSLAAKAPTQAVRTAAKKGLAKKFFRGNIDRVSDEAVDEFLKVAAKNLDSEKAVDEFITTFKAKQNTAKALLQNTPTNDFYKKHLNNLVANYGKMTNSTSPYKLNKLITSIRNTDNYRKFISISNVINKADKIDKAMLNAATILNPGIGVGRIGIKYLIKPLFKHTSNLIVKTLQQAQLSDLTSKRNVLVKEVQSKINNVYYAAHKELIDDFDSILKQYDINFEKLQNMYIDILLKTPEPKLTIEYVDNAFLKALSKSISEVKYINKESKLYDSLMEFLNGLKPTDTKLNSLIPGVRAKSLQDFIDIIHETSILKVSADDYFKRINLPKEESLLEIYKNMIGMQNNITNELKASDEILNDIHAKYYESILKIEDNIKALKEQIATDTLDMQELYNSNYKEFKDLDKIAKESNDTKKLIDNNNSKLRTEYKKIDAIDKSIKEIKQAIKDIELLTVSLDLSKEEQRNWFDILAKRLKSLDKNLKTLNKEKHNINKVINDIIANNKKLSDNLIFYEDTLEKFFTERPNITRKNYFELGSLIRKDRLELAKQQRMLKYIDAEYSKELTAASNRRIALEQLQNDITTVLDTRLNSLDRMDSLDRILKTKGRKYGIDNLESLLLELQNTDTQSYESITSLLKLIGITEDNYHRVYTAYKAGDEQAVNDLLTKETERIIGREGIIKNKKQLYRNVSGLQIPKLKVDLDKTDKELLKVLDSTDKNIPKTIRHNAQKASINYRTVRDRINKIFDTYDFELDPERQEFIQFLDMHAFEEGSIDAIIRNIDVYKMPRKTKKVFKKLVANKDNITKDMLDPYLKYIDFYNLIEDVYPNVHYTDIRDEIYKTIDSFYTATTKHNREYFLKVMNSKLDFDNLDPVAMQQYIEDVDALKRKVYGWLQQIKRGELQADPTTQRFLRDVQNVLKSEEVKKELGTMKELANTLQEAFTDYPYYYTPQMAALGRLAYIGTSLSNIRNQEVADLLDLVSNTSKPIRSNLYEAIRILTKEGSDTSLRAADNIKEFLSHLDAYNNTILLLNGVYNADKKLDNIIRGEIFNTIFRYKDDKYYYVKPEDYVDFLTNDVMHNIELNFSNELDRVIQESTIKNLPDINNMTDEAIAKLGYTREELMENPELLENLIEETDTLTVGKIKANIKEALNAYVNRQINIRDLNQFEVPLYYEFNDSAVNSLSILGQEYGNTISALVNNKAPKYVVEDVQKIIENFSGAYIQDDGDFFYNKLIQSIEDGLTDAQLEEMFNDAIKELANNSLGKALTEAFRNIKKINLDLAGNGAFLGYNIDGSKIYDTIRYYNADLANKKIFDLLNLYNTYQASTVSGYLAYKKTIDNSFIIKNNLQPTNFKAGSADYTKLYHAYDKAYARVSKYPAYKKSRITDTRLALITFFKENKTNWGPIDPDNYFKNLTSDQVLAWDTILRSKMFSPSDNKKYTKLWRRLSGEARHKTATIDKFIDPRSIYYEIDEALMDPNPMTDRWSKLVKEAPTLALDEIILGVAADLDKSITDLKTLKDFAPTYSIQIKVQKKALDELRKLNKLLDDTRTVGEVIKNENTLSRLRKFNITEDTAINSDLVFKYIFKEREMSLYNSVTSFNAKQLRSYIDHETDGFLFVKSTDGNFPFSFNEKQAKEAGLKFTKYPGEEGAFIIRRTDNKITDVPYSYEKMTSAFKEQDDLITEVFNNNKLMFDWDGMSMPESIFTGNMLDRHNYEIIKNDERIKDFIGDIVGQKSYSKINKSGSNNFYTSKNSRPDAVFIGPNAYNIFLDITRRGSNGAALKEGGYSNNILTSVFAGSIDAIKRQNATSKYASILFNDDFFIGNDTFKPMFEKATDKEINEFFGSGSCSIHLPSIKWGLKLEITLETVFFTLQFMFRSVAVNSHTSRNNFGR